MVMYTQRGVQHAEENGKTRGKKAEDGGDKLKVADTLFRLFEFYLLAETCNKPSAGVPGSALGG